MNKNFWKRFLTWNPHHNDGFTLVELIVVIAILAILAAVAVPAYSGYIEKANKAGDETLVAAVNKAFVSACLENAIDNTRLLEGEVAIPLLDGTIDFDRVMPAAIAADFKTYMEGNAETKFKVFKSLQFVEVIGTFKGSEKSAFNELFNSLKEKYGTAIAEKILTSSLGAIGTENLFDQMNSAMDLAGELNLANMTGAPFMEAFLGYLGIDPDDYDDNDAAQVALDAKLESLGGIDEETAMTHAIALYAAQNSAGLTTDSLSKWLGGETTTEDLQNNANANTLAEAAAIYGMYMSYCKETTGTAPTGNTLDVLTEALTQKEFATWVGDSNGSAQSELDAYKTYMDIVNEAAKDESARDEILANGFTNPELEDLMKDLIGS